MNFIKFHGLEKLYKEVEHWVYSRIYLSCSHSSLVSSLWDIVCTFFCAHWSPICKEITGGFLHSITTAVFRHFAFLQTNLFFCKGCHFHCMTIFYFTFIWTCVRTSTGSSDMTRTCGTHPPIFVAAELYTKQIFFRPVIYYCCWWTQLMRAPFTPALEWDFVQKVYKCIDLNLWLRSLNFIALI